MSDLKTTITKDGQRYVDEAIVVRPRSPSALEHSVAAAFGEPQARTPITVGHERVLLRWMKPDGKGGLVPRDGGKR